MAPLGLLQRLKEYWPYGKTTETPPPLSTSFAVSLSIAFTIFYVAPFYLSSTTRPSRTISRDSPSVIKARIRMVYASCLISSAVVIYILSVPGHLPYYETLHLLGLWPVSFWSIAGPLALISILWAGPLFESLVVEESWREYAAKPGMLISELTSAQGFRNYVAGPFTEELLFRSLLIPVNMLTPQVTQASTGLSGTHARIVMLTTPLYFAVAHAHHLYEFRLQHPQIPFMFALMRTLFQLLFTTIFGWYAAFVFLRTGSLWACVLTHTFCNWMGLPRVWGQVERYKPKFKTWPKLGPFNPPTPKAAGDLFKSSKPKPEFKPTAPVAMGPPTDEPGAKGSTAPSKFLTAAENEQRILNDPAYIKLTTVNEADLAAYHRARGGSFTRSRSTPPRMPRDYALHWTIAYYVMLFAGIVGFYKGLWTLTENPGRLADI